VTDGLCPACGGEAWKYCWTCDDYVDELRDDAKKPSSPTKASTDMSPPFEKEVQTAIKRYLAQVADAVVVDTSQPRASMVTEGLSDLIVLSPSKGAVFVEVKRPGEQPTVSQEEFGAACEAAGVPWLVWWSVEDAVAWWEDG